jgi:hypothetical protein
VTTRAVLLVDRPATLARLAKTDAIAQAGIAVVCIDGTPRSVVARLERAFRTGLRAPVLYLHDAASVVYPFAIEPLATLVRRQEGRPIVYRDLGLPPLGATARRFGDPTLGTNEPILELKAIGTATLARYCVKSAASLVDAEPVASDRP